LRGLGSSVLLLELTERPSIEAVFGESPFSAGVEAVLQGRTDPDSIVCRRPDTGLYLMTMKHAIVLELDWQTPADRLSTLLQYAKERFDWTVIDGPGAD
jgi:cellulose biosynthesis protein BcsQ